MSALSARLEVTIAPTKPAGQTAPGTSVRSIEGFAAYSDDVSVIPISQQINPAVGGLGQRLHTSGRLPANKDYVCRTR